MSLIADVTSAIVSALNEHTFSQSFTAQRAYRPIFELKEMAALHVTVVPKGIEYATVSRGSLQKDLQVDIGVQKKLASASVTEIDTYADLVEEIADFIRETGRFGDATWVKTENSPIYSPEHLSEWRQFTSVLTLTLRVMM